MDVVVQPSVPWMSLNEQVKSDGLFFPVDPSPTVSFYKSINTISTQVDSTGTNWRNGRDRLQVGENANLNPACALTHTVVQMPSDMGR